MRQKKYHSNRFFNLIIFILVVLFSIACYTSLLRSNTVREVQFVTTVVLFMTMLYYFYKNRLTSRISTYLILYYALILGYWAIGYSTASSGNYFMQITFFIPIVAAVYSLRNMTNRNVSILFYVILTIIVFLFATDISIGRMYSDASFAELAEDGSSVDVTSVSTTALMIFSISFLIVLNTSNHIVRWINIALIVLTFYYIVFIGQRGSVTILMFISVALILYNKYYSKSLSTRILVISITSILLLFMIFDIDAVFQLLMSLSPNDRLTDRLFDIMYTYEHGVYESSFSGRLRLEVISIQSWLRNPTTFFWGIGDQRSSSGIQGFVESGIGGHSELIDSLARYGVVGFCIIAALYIYICKYILSLFPDPKIRKQVLAVIITTLLTALTKSLFYPNIGIAILLLLPLSSVIINNKKIIS